MQKIQSMSKAQHLTFLGLMTALVVVLQLMGSFIRFGLFSVSLVLIPIVLGAALAGPLEGGWLGFVFGAAVLLSGDANLFIAVSIPGTLITVLVKGTAAGLIAGLVYRLIEKKNRWVAILAAAIVCPVVNTGVFFAGCYLFFFDALSASAGGSNEVFMYIITVMIGWNFLFELLFNIALSPAVLRLTEVGEKIFRNRKR